MHTGTQLRSTFPAQVKKTKQAAKITLHKLRKRSTENFLHNRFEE
jgi:hypothetical protein